MSFDEYRVGRLAALLIAGVLLACSSDHPPGPPLVELSPGQRAPYVIGVTDRLTVTVWKNHELGVVVPVRRPWDSDEEDRRRRFQHFRLERLF